MKILVTGGCGYVGSVLVPKLLTLGHVVGVLDLEWFGNTLPPSNEKTFHSQRRDFRSLRTCEGWDAIIHLAGVANDPCGELNPKLSWDINALGTAQLADLAVRGGVKQFIYASSGSVYGVSSAPEVTETQALVPISEYNKTKMVAERVLLSYSDRMAVQILRPATVCGYSPRMRLDVVVNMFVCQAMKKGKITVFGGEQMRPNIHIEDMCDAYIWMLDHPHLTGIYNAGFENMSVMDIANLVSDNGRAYDIVTEASTDPRSYRINSDKLLMTGFKPNKTVKQAVLEMAERWIAGEITDSDNCYNLKAMNE